MAFSYGDASSKRLQGVHPLLVDCANKALQYQIEDIAVPMHGGVRTARMQQTLVENGASKTTNSLHLVQSSGYGHAVDLVPYPVDFKDLYRFYMVATLMFKAAAIQGTPLEWGGHWPTFKDYAHFQLPRGFSA